ncbi:deoxyribodipyrimidine photo-lyase [Romeria aff. gracilis LEGE 07310]|uniref:Deoxyribodipyrimidine photo-lyase n=1 Tax=Vasconcelosia minhoensis LEGE 07310 TaxID=915328 RepID=A0A8J7ALM0_9CYAN|nr:deoxyribodipyrimidine photo-lyase [Romeria gracilis]MBE9077250.1 deoxyribodipyrimidine photo-lyase [Romeria aff. gracilis LEGE 07310]
MNRTLVWFRRDLRIADHAPLYRAARRGAVIPVFVFDRALLHHPETGAARVRFMLDCLSALDDDLSERGGRLILRYGDPVKVLPELVRQTGADGIYSYTDCERIYGRMRDARLNRVLAEANLKIRWFEPVASAAELMPYPHYRDWWYQEMRSPMVPIPPSVTVPEDIFSEPLPNLARLDHLDDGKAVPKCGTAEARRLLQEFIAEKADRYYWRLSYPSAEATTGLSAHIKFGAITIRECVQTIWQAQDGGDYRVSNSYQQLVSRLRWGNGFTQRFRYLPQLELRSLYTPFDDDGWEFDEALYTAWQQGQTGFPIIDAAARCLQATGGWLALNFRSRAMYASFLSNLLGIDWRYGALHFMRHLIDGDCPIDHYQWAMQSGVTHCIDKSWTRIYNPGQTAVDRCDPEGSFIRRWVPEVAHLPAGQLGSSPPVSGYPAPIVSYAQARQRRISQLERQRDRILTAPNVVPFVTRLPQDLTPFGADRYPSEVAWSRLPNTALFPAGLDLDQLNLEQAKTLRTWFVVHVDSGAWAKRQRSRPRSKSPSDSQQLSLLTNLL